MNKEDLFLTANKRVLASVVDITQPDEIADKLLQLSNVRIEYTRFNKMIVSMVLEAEKQARRRYALDHG